MKLIQIGAAIAATSMLAGCLGSTGNKVSATPEAFAEGFQATTGLGVTTTPLDGRATYTGEMQIMTLANGQESGSIRGALELTADFASATPFTMSATNFSGEINGEETTFSGTLTHDQSTNSQAFNEIRTTALPAIAGNRELSALALSFGGTLTEDATGVENKFEPGSNLMGNFYGNDGQAVAGAVGVAITPTGGTSAITGANFGAQTGGQFYAEQ
ncbi:MAG: hypothetical protein VX874_00465 [Pseudomonadota bacterium]|nr:hypothetical protein [Pseudomonadota bacterium]